MTDTNEDTVKLTQEEGDAPYTSPDNPEGKEEAPSDMMSLFQAASFLFCNVMGCGIFITVGPTLAIFSSTNMYPVIIVWVIGGVFSLACALCYAELASRIPQGGGETIFYEKAFGRPWSVLFILLYALIIRAICVAAIALTASKYLVNSMPFINASSMAVDPTKLVALIIIVISCIVNCFSDQVAGKLSVVFLVCKLAAGALIIGPGLYTVLKGKSEGWSLPAKWEGFTIAHLSVAVVNVAFSYDGWNALSQNVNRIERASKRLFPATAIALIGVIIVYSLCVVSYTAVLGFNETRAAETAGVMFGESFFKKYFWILTLAISVSASGSVMCLIFAISKLLSAASFPGKMQCLPAFVGYVHPTTQIPIFAVVFTAAWSSIWLFIDFQSLLQYSSFATWLFYSLSFAALLKFKWKDLRETRDGDIFSIHYVFIVPVLLVSSYLTVAAFYSTVAGCSAIFALMSVVLGVQYLPIGERFKTSAGSFIATMNNKVEHIFGLVPSKPQS